MLNFQNKQIEKLVIAVLFLLACLFLFLTLYFVKLFFYGQAMSDGLNSMTVSATGEVKAVPNIATFSFAAVESGKDVNEAQSKMAEVANKAVAYLKSKGIEDKDIQTTNYSANPKYIYNLQTGRQTLDGYEARETVTVKVRDATKAGEFLSGVGQLGVSDLSNLSFESEDKEELKQQATEDAIKKAKAKAERLAKAGGFRLGRIMNFYEQEAPPPGPFPYEGAMDKAVMSAPVAPEIQVGENSTFSTVSIIYEIK